MADFLLLRIQVQQTAFMDAVSAHLRRLGGAKHTAEATKGLMKLSGLRTAQARQECGDQRSAGMERDVPPLFAISTNRAAGSRLVRANVWLDNRSSQWGFGSFPATCSVVTSRRWARTWRAEPRKGPGKDAHHQPALTGLGSPNSPHKTCSPANKSAFDLLATRSCRSISMRAIRNGWTSRSSCCKSSVRVRARRAGSSRPRSTTSSATCRSR